MDAIYTAIIGLLLSALGALVAFFGTGVRSDIRALTKKIDDHIENDSERFSESASQRSVLMGKVSKIEGKLGI